LRSKAATRRAAAYAMVEMELAGPAFGALEVSLAQWTEPRFGEPGITKKTDRPLGDVAPELLAKMHRKVRRRGRHIDSNDLRKLHDIRKSVKKLRYGAEAMTDVFSHNAVKKFVKPTKKLEKCFGQLNDAATARRQLATLSVDGGVGILPGTAAMDDWCAARAEKDLAAVRAAWREFDAAPRFWQ